MREELELREIVGVPTARSVQKERSTLDEHDRAFIARSPFLLIATAGADGRCDISPKGDAQVSCWCWTTGGLSSLIVQATNVWTA